MQRWASRPRGNGDVTPLQLLAVRHFGVGRGTRPRRTRPRADRLGRVACRPAGAPRRRPAPRPETSYPLLKETGGSVSIPPSSTGETGCGGLDASPPGRRGCQSREALPAAVTAPLPSVWRRPSCVRAAAGRPWGVVPHYPPPPRAACHTSAGRAGGGRRAVARVPFLQSRPPAEVLHTAVPLGGNPTPPCIGLFPH